MQNKLEKIFFSQNSLEIFNQCKMRFKKRYLDGLYWKNWVIDSKKSALLEKGRLFHLLAYRYFLNFDTGVDLVSSEFPELVTWVENLKKFVKLDESNTYYPEYELRMCMENLRLQAKFDLIVIENNQKAIIYDWKIQEKPLNYKYLKSCFQTIIYRYLLAKAGKVINGIDIYPENITMIYWDPSYPSKPVKLSYSTSAFSVDEQLIKEEISKILYCNFESPDIKTMDNNICKHCEYCSICNNTQPILDDIYYDYEDINGLNWDEIIEIEF